MFSTITDTISSVNEYPTILARRFTRKRGMCRVKQHENIQSNGDRQNYAENSAITSLRGVQIKALFFVVIVVFTGQCGVSLERRHGDVLDAVS